MLSCLEGYPLLLTKQLLDSLVSANPKVVSRNGSGMCAHTNFTYKVKSLHFEIITLRRVLTKHYSLLEG